MVQALAFAELLFGGILVVSAITKEPIGEILTKGVTATGKQAAKAQQAQAVAQNLQAGAQPASSPRGGPAGKSYALPFSGTDLKEWGRSDQGVDGTLHPNAPLYALGAGVITIEHDAQGFGQNYPVLHLATGESFYYGHTVPVVANGTHVQAGQVIARANTHGQGNATVPGWFEFGTWPPGNINTAGAAIRGWLTKFVGPARG
jgi:Peptidase family M23